MAEYLTRDAVETVALNSPIPFIDSIPCNRGNVFHQNGTGIFVLRGITPNCFARYSVEFTGNIAIPEGGAVTPIAVAITLNGVAIPDSVAIVTPAAAEDVWHVNTTATITVPCGCCVSISAAYVDATEDDATVTPTPSIFVRRLASITVTRTA